MSKPTPRPWKRSGNALKNNETVPLIIGEDCSPVAVGYYADEQASVNAAHIVKCVNSYDNLIFVLETVESYLRTGQRFISQAGIDNMLTLIREQLTKAEGRGG